MREVCGTDSLLERSVDELVLLTSVLASRERERERWRSACVAGLSAEPLVFVQDDVDETQEEVSSGDCTDDGGAPWYLRVQELAHDSLIAATRAQLARDARNSTDHIHSGQSEQKKEPRVHRCPYETCHRTFTYPAHLKYHLKTHRWPLLTLGLRNYLRKYDQYWTLNGRKKACLLSWGHKRALRAKYH